MSTFREALARKVLVLDGAMGTQLHAADLDLERDYEGLENCCEVINVTRPDVIHGIHAAFLDVGCDAVETNTFGGMAHVLSEFGLEGRTREINRKAAEIARQACDERSSADRPRFALGSMGPGTKLPSLGQARYDLLKASYTEAALGLVEGGIDAFAIETCQDPLQIKAAVNAALAARKELARDVPIMVSVTMEVTGTMLVGTEMAAAIALLDPYPIEVLSLNCATGPREMSSHVRLLSRTARTKIGCYPNAGLPQLVDGQPSYPLTPQELADWLMRFVEEDGLDLVGGCCGTTPEHMARVVRALGERAPVRRKPSWSAQVTSLYAAVDLVQESSVLLVGERANANGSKRFRESLLNEDLEGMLQVGREQVREGSHVIDVCTAYVGRDEVRDMSRVVERYRTDVSAPLMLDSTDAKALEASLKLAGGRCIVNSINLEDGLERCEQVLPLVKEFGAAVVALTIDEDGMARTAEEKLRIARRLHRICVEDWGLKPEDLLFDVLTFTICTGSEDDRKHAIETLAGVRRVREELPGVGTILGLSNVSFGLRPAARHALNSVFLHHAQEAGLSAAILHAGRIEPLHKIDPEARQVCEDLIFDRRREGYDPLHALMALFENVDVAAREARRIPEDLFERLRWRIVEGEKEGLEQDLVTAMQTKPPLEIVNQDLLAGMAVVGELFGKGEMQLPFVLQSAETMKAAVAVLEPHMERVEGSSRGKIVLATVRGDVHDIGKNLVDIILTNNGYTVFNLGIKQPIERILEVTGEHRPHVIGLSGLLVKSTVIMRENLEEMQRRKLSLPVILGGAALTRSYVEDDCRRIYDGAVYYAKDAFEGLETMKRVVAGEARPEPRATKKRERSVAELDSEALGELLERARRPEPDKSSTGSDARRGAREVESPEPPFLGPRLLEEIPLQSIFPWVNEITLFQFQWGYRRKGRTSAAYERLLDEKVRPLFHSLAAQCAKEKILEPKAAYGFWRCVAEGDTVILLHPEDEAREVARFAFPRQRGKQNLCIADYFRGDGRGNGRGDGRPEVIGLQVVTVGQRASDVAREWFAADRYQDYLHLHGLSVEAAEGLAEYVHRQVRADLGIVGEDAREMRELFKQGYRGCRWSFGYPACPNLEDQEQLLGLLGASRLGLELGEGHQLWPEQSTSAVISHHPDARYFTL